MRIGVSISCIRISWLNCPFTWGFVPRLAEEEGESVEDRRIRAEEAWRSAQPDFGTDRIIGGGPQNTEGNSTSFACGFSLGKVVHHMAH